MAAETKRTDPSGGAVTVTLKAHDLDGLDPNLVFSGRVLDEGGNPVANATVSPTGTLSEGRRSFGWVDEADPLAITDEQGRFRLGLKKRLDGLYVTVRGPLLAPLQTGPLKAGPVGNALTVVEGVTVQGRVEKAGKPLVGVTLRLRQNMVQDANRKLDRAMIELAFEIDTDARGNFRFVNVPPDEDYLLIGRMDSFRAHGALKGIKVATKANRTTIDLGTLAAQPGSRLAGRIVLADGKPVPAGTRVSISRREEAAYDWQATTAGADGRFEFTGVPDEVCQLDTGVKGYCVSTKNYSCDRRFGYGLWGRVDQDITNLQFLLEPGEFAVLRIDDPEVTESLRRRQHRMQGAALKD